MIKFRSLIKMDTTIKYKNMKRLLTLLALGLMFFQMKGQNFTISGSNTHSVALCQGGKVFAWGKNDVGQIGVNTSTIPAKYTAASYNTPQEVGGMSEIFQIDAGSGSHTLALTCDGKVYAWGLNKDGQLGLGTNTLSEFKPTLISKGAAPGNTMGQLTGVKYVSGGNDASYAILNNGKLLSWGLNDKGQLGNGTTTNSNVPVYVKSGIAYGGQTLGGDLINVIQTEAGDENGYALTADGTIWSWGDRGDNGGTALGRDNKAQNLFAYPMKINATTYMTNAVSISAGDRHLLVIDNTGVVWSVGGDWGGGQLGLGNGFQNLDFLSKVNAPGVLVNPGTSFLGEVDPIVQIAAGQAHSMAVGTSGKVYTWGSNVDINRCSPLAGATPTTAEQTCNGNPDISGQLGQNLNQRTTSNHTWTTAEPYFTNGADGVWQAPKEAVYFNGTANVPFTNAIGVSDGDSWSFVITKDSRVYVAGSNYEGHLGIGGTADALVFKELTFPTTCPIAIPCPEVFLKPSQEACTVSNFNILAKSFDLPTGFSYTLYKNGVVDRIDNFAFDATKITTPRSVTTLLVNDFGTYRLEMIDNRPVGSRPCNPCPNVDVTIVLSKPVANFSDPTGLKFCGSSVNVKVKEQGANLTSAGNTYAWFTAATGGTRLGTGANPVSKDQDSLSISTTGLTFTGTAPTRTATVYVEDISTFTTTTATKAQIGASNPQTYGKGKIQVKTLTALSFNSLKMDYINYNTNPVVVTIANAGGTVLATSNSVAAGPIGSNTATLTFPTSVSLPPGNYTITSTKDGASHTVVGNAYTATYAFGGKNILNILDSDGVKDVYAMFYDFNVTVGNPYPCGRVPVQIKEECLCNKPTSVTITNGDTVNTCVGTAVTLNGSYVAGTGTPVTGMKYVWYKEGATLGAYTNTTGTINSFLPPVTTTAVGSNVYVLRVEDGSAGTATCYKEAKVTVNVGAIPTFTLAAQTVCSGVAADTAKLVANPSNSTFAWTKALVGLTGGPATPGTGNIAGAAYTTTTGSNGTATYTITATGPKPTNCPAAPRNYVITVKPVPTVTAIDSASICSGVPTTMKPINLTTTITGVTYSWTRTLSTGVTGTGLVSGTTASIPSQTFTGKGTVTYAITATNGGMPDCPSKVVNYVITVNPNPTATLSAGDTICAASTTNNLTVTPSGGVPNYKIDYKNPAGTPQSITVSGTTGSITANAAGDYTLTRVEDGNKCFTTLTTKSTIVHHPALVVTPDTATCNYTTKEATVTGTVSGGKTNYSSTGRVPASVAAMALNVTTGDFSASFLANGNINYDFDFGDASNCPANVGEIKGAINCNCPVSGTLTGGAAICPGGTTDLTVTITNAPSTSDTIIVTIGISGNTTSDVTDTIIGDGTITFPIAYAKAGAYVLKSVVNTSKGNCNGAPSGSATVTANTKPTWTTNLVTETLPLCPKTDIKLTVAATGTAVAVKWQKDGLDIPGATADTFSITRDLVAADAGVYRAVATGTCGTEYSNAKTYSINDTVRITTNLSTTQVNLCPNAKLSLTVTATGTLPLSYAWTRSGTAIASTTNAFSKTNVASADSGDYKVTVSNVCGPLTSAITPVVIDTATVLPALKDTIICPNNSFKLTVEPTGTPPVGGFTYAWTKTGTAPSAATNASSYAVTNAVAGDAGTYTLTVNGKCNPATRSAVVKVGTTTAITTQPIGGSDCVGQGTTSFTVIAVGDSLSYIWKKDGADVGNLSTYTIAGPIAEKDSGTYSVEVKGTCGTVVSNDAVFKIDTVTVPNVILEADKDKVCNPSDVVFTAKGSGTGATPTYQFRNGVGGAILQAFSASKTYTFVGMTANTIVEVEMVSSTTCLKQGASNTPKATASVTVVQPPVAAITSPSLLAGQTIYYTDTTKVSVKGTNTGTGGVTGYSASWTTTGAKLGNTSTFDTDIDSLSFDTPVTLEITVRDADAVCPASKAAITIERKDITPAVIAGGVFCENSLPRTINGVSPLKTIPVESSTIDLVPNGTTAATTLSSITNSLVIPLGHPTGTYDVNYKITNPLGGSSTDTKTVQIDAMPSAAIAGTDATICTDAYQLAATTPLIGKGTWSCTGATVTDINNPTANLTSIAENATVTCNWVVSNGVCPSKQDEVVIKRVGKATAADILVNSISQTGKTLDLCVTDVSKIVTASAPNATDGETGAWTITGTSVTNVSNASTNPNIGAMSLASTTVPQITTLTWSITPTIAGCNPSNATLVVNVYPVPVAGLIGPASSCKDTTQLTYTTTTTYGVGSWFNTPKAPLAGAIAGEYTIAANQLNSGSNNFTWQVTNKGCGTRYSTEVITTINDIKTPSVILNDPKADCEGATFDLLASPQQVGTLPNYEWFVGNSSQGVSTNSTFTTLPIYANSKVRVVVTPTDGGCYSAVSASDDTDLMVSPGPLPRVKFEDSTICVTNPINLIGEELQTTGASDYTYTWKRVDLNNPLISETLKQTGLILNNVAVAGDYYLVAFSPVCGTAISINHVNLKVDQVPTVNAYVNGINPLVVFRGEPLALSGYHNGTSATWSTSSSSTAGSFANQNAIVDIAALNSPILTADEQMDNFFKAYLTSINGLCSARDSVNIRIKIPIKAPNVFTVNGDGINETFTIRGIETFPEARVYIYNRWGNKVYETLNYAANPWDGADYPEGVYYFIIETGEETKKGDGISGVIHLMRGQ
jgi:gliding motility-associated-like protein